MPSRFVCAALLCAGIARGGAAQTVSPDSLSIADSIFVRYRVNTSGRQTASVVVVAVRAPVQRMEGPSSEWVLESPKPGDSLATWRSGSAAADVVPGTFRTGFVLTAASGLPDIVTYWVEGRSGSALAADAAGMAQHGGQGQTVGIAAVADQSPGALLSRLYNLQIQACTLAWITNRGDCNSLLNKVAAAREELSRNHPQPAAQQLEALLRQLNGKHSPGAWESVTDNAYWLLRANTEFVMARLK